MSIFPRQIQDKHCFVQCPPERCNCRVGNPLEWAAQQARLGITEDRQMEQASKIPEFNRPYMALNYVSKSVRRTAAQPKPIECTKCFGCPCPLHYQASKQECWTQEQVDEVNTEAEKLLSEFTPGRMDTTGASGLAITAQPKQSDVRGNMSMRAAFEDEFEIKWEEGSKQTQLIFALGYAAAPAPSVLAVVKSALGATFHRKIAKFLSKRDQGYVMNAFRSTILDFEGEKSLATRMAKAGFTRRPSKKSIRENE